MGAQYAAVSVLVAQVVVPGPPARSESGVDEAVSPVLPKKSWKCAEEPPGSTIGSIVVDRPVNGQFIQISVCVAAWADATPANARPAAVTRASTILRIGSPSGSSA